MSFSQVGIGTNSPHSSAMLDLTSTTQGFLPPRMTAAQRIAIASPVVGLEIWCTDCGTYGETQIYNGSTWTNLTGGTIAEVITQGTATSLGATSPIGIGTNTPNAAAALELKSTSKGFLTPRMTATQRNAMEPSATAAGLQVWCTDCGTNGELSIFNGAYWAKSTGGFATNAPPFQGNATCDGSRPTVIKDVSFTYIGVTYTWMDRNLGASRAATVYNDSYSYGCSYQWGRGNDGHASINGTSATAGTTVNGATSTTSGTTVPGNALFITTTTNDWMTISPSPGTRWNTLMGNNNPCPTGYRIPNTNEMLALGNYSGFAATGISANWPKTSSTSWFSNILKLPTAGYKSSTNTFGNTGSNAYLYFIKDATSAGGGRLYSNSVGSSASGYAKLAESASVRCIKSTVNPY